MSFENSAVNHLKDTCLTLNVLDFKTTTIHKVLSIDLNDDNVKQCINFNNYDIVIIDEIFRVDISLMTKLYLEMKKYKGVLILLGDSAAYGLYLASVMDRGIGILSDV